MVTQCYEDFIKSYREDSDIGYFLQVDVQYPEELHELHNDFPFLPERMKIEKIEKLVWSLNDKENVIHTRTLKETLNHGLVLEKMRGAIKFNQKTWLKPYIDMNTGLRKNVKKMTFNKIFST